MISQRESGDRLERGRPPGSIARMRRLQNVSEVGSPVDRWICPGNNGGRPKINGIVLTLHSDAAVCSRRVDCHETRTGTGRRVPRKLWKLFLLLPVSLFLSITERQINLMLTVDPGSSWSIFRLRFSWNPRNDLNAKAKRAKIGRNMGNGITSSRYSRFVVYPLRMGNRRRSNDDSLSYFRARN